MNYQEVLKLAKDDIGPYCKACPICNGKACKNMMPGPGAKGDGTGAIRNYDKWQDILLNMDTIHANNKVDTSFELFGHKFDLPVFAGPVGAVKLHYGDKYTDQEYNDILVSACKENGILAFTGDGTDPGVVKAASKTLIKNSGIGIPTIKPWSIDIVKEKIDEVMQSDPVAIAMDIDASGLPFLKNQTPPAGFKTTDELKDVIKLTDKPFIIKGIMTVNGAKKALEAGAKGIIVSNHGGRVLDNCPATAEVLEEITKFVDKRMLVLVDGGIRTGLDVFKALALGADGVLIARPFVNVVYGAQSEGVKIYVQKLKDELIDAMSMCGADSLKDINRSMIRTS